MLRNNSSKTTPAVLPLDIAKYKKVLIVGENATRSLTQGGGSSELKTLRDVSPLEALQKALSGTTVEYAKGYVSGRAMYDHVDKVNAAESEKLKNEAVEKAKDADIIIFIGGLNKNHKQDCENGDRESYDLPFGQNELITAMAEAKQQTAKIIVVTFGGNPYAMPWLQQTDAILHCWYLGSESGTALANIITGKVCPSGKLPVTVAAKYEDYPYMKFGKEAYPGVDKQVYYKEDVFVGYRGFEKDKTAPLFPFGFGMSYTTFSYTGMEAVRTAEGKFNISITVSNTGAVPGKEIAQLYVTAPKTKTMLKPAKELKAFAKTRLLKPGESQTLTMTITPQDLASWDENSHQWITDSGKYTILAGASSADIKGKCTINL
jgi:beta-glucosidase